MWFTNFRTILKTLLICIVLYQVNMLQSDMSIYSSVYVQERGMTKKRVYQRYTRISRLFRCEILYRFWHPSSVAPCIIATFGMLSSLWYLHCERHEANCSISNCSSHARDWLLETRRCGRRVLPTSRYCKPRGWPENKHWPPFYCGSVR